MNSTPAKFTMGSHADDGDALRAANSAVSGDVLCRTFEMLITQIADLRATVEKSNAAWLAHTAHTDMEKPVGSTFSALSYCDRPLTITKHVRVISQYRWLVATFGDAGEIFTVYEGNKWRLNLGARSGDAQFKSDMEAALSKCPDKGWTELQARLDARKEPDDFEFTEELKCSTLGLASAHELVGMHVLEAVLRHRRPNVLALGPDCVIFKILAQHAKSPHTALKCAMATVVDAMDMVQASTNDVKLFDWCCGPDLEQLYMALVRDNEDKARRLLQTLPPKAKRLFEKDQDDVNHFTGYIYRACLQ